MVRSDRRLPSTTARRSVLAGLVLVAAPGLLRAACAPPQVLFVCPFGTVKSAIARETLKRRAAEAGVPVRVRSRGVDVQDHLSPRLAAALAADGLNPAAEPPRKLSAADLTPGQIVIAFDEAAQDPRLRDARAWDMPSWNDDYARAKASLEVQVAALLAELRRRGDRACPGA